MLLRNRSVALALAVVLPLAPALLWAQGGGQGKRKPTVAPPKFEQAVLDVFFADANAELVGEPPDPNRPAGSAPAETGTSGPAVATGGDGFSWQTLISADTLEGEIKTGTTQVAEVVGLQTKFSTGHSLARKVYSIMAVAFHIISRYDGEVKWKDKAAGLRDGLSKAAANSKVLSEQAWREARLRHEEMSQLLRGDSLNVPDSEADPTWPEVADRPPLMQRLDEAKNQLLPWTANSGDFKAHKDEVLREAQMLAILARIIQDPNYEFADDSSYQEYATALQAGSQGLLEAVAADDADKAQASMGIVTKACDDCHGGFR
jgi:hypothetical protein